MNSNTSASKPAGLFLSFAMICWLIRTEKHLINLMETVESRLATHRTRDIFRHRDEKQQMSAFSLVELSLSFQAAQMDPS